VCTVHTAACRYAAQCSSVLRPSLWTHTHEEKHGGAWCSWQLSGTAAPATVTKSSYKNSSFRNVCHGLDAVHEDTELRTAVKLNLRDNEAVVDERDALLQNRELEIERLTRANSEMTAQIAALTAEATVDSARISALNDTISTRQAERTAQQLTAQLLQHNQSLTSSLQVFQTAAARDDELKQLKQYNVALQNELDSAMKTAAITAAATSSATDAAAEREAKLVAHIDELQQQLTVAKAALDDTTNAITKVPTLEVCTQVRCHAASFKSKSFILILLWQQM
jgi:hypothetical protein